MQAAPTADNSCAESHEKITGVTSRNPPVRDLGNTVNTGPEDHSGLLDPIIGIKKPRADCPHLWSIP